MTTTQTAPETTDAADPEVVAERMAGIMNDGAICLLAGIGHDLGLFDALADLPPATSEQLADAAGLDERYVREWLGGVVTAGFVHYVPEDDTYALRPDHAPFLTGSSPDNLVRVMRYVALMGQVTSQVVEKFRTGGGLSYDDYPGFHAIQAAESGAVNDASLIDTIIPVTGLTERLEAGIRVADVGCGEGHAINLLARAYPASSFVGFDFSEEALAAARAEAAAWGLTNATFETRDLPWASFLYAISVVHCMSVSLGQGGEGLGTVWGVQTAERMVRGAGFSDVVLHELEEDPFNAYFVAHA